MTVIIGLAPSTKNEDPMVPFKGTKSWDRLQRWIKAANIRSYSIGNLFHHVLQSPPSMEELRQAALKLKEYCRYSDGVVALGVDVSRALKAAGIEHYRMPHPSGRNRQFNHKDYEAAILIKFKNWVESIRDEHEQG